MFLLLQLDQAPALYDLGTGPVVIALPTPPAWCMDLHILPMQASFPHNDHASVPLLPDYDYSNDSAYSDVNNKDTDTLTTVLTDVDSVSTDDGSTGIVGDDTLDLILPLPPLFKIFPFCGVHSAPHSWSCSLNCSHESGATVELNKMVMFRVPWPLPDEFFFDPWIFLDKDFPFLHPYTGEIAPFLY